MERKPINENEEIILWGQDDSKGFQRTFTIINRLDLDKEGASVICYEAKCDQIGKGVLKEFYPTNSISIHRNDNCQLVHINGKENQKQQFEEKLANYIEHYSNTVFKARNNPDVANVIPSFEIYRGLDNNGLPLGTAYIWTISKYITFEEICKSSWKEYELTPEKYILTILKAIESLLNGVMVLHKNGYIHRDIKPNNFGFLKYNNEVSQTVSFFDVDTLLSVDNISNSNPIGSFGYLEPESANCNPSILTDIYGIGATLLFAINDTYCNYDYGFDKKIEKIVDDSEVLRNLSSDAIAFFKFKKAIIKLLRKSLCSRHERYQCCEDMLDDVRLALQCINPILSESNAKKLLLERLRNTYDGTKVAYYYEFFKAGNEIYDLCKVQSLSCWIILLKIDFSDLEQHKYDFRNKKVKAMLEEFDNILCDYCKSDIPIFLSAKLKGHNYGLFMLDDRNVKRPELIFSSIQKEFKQLATDELTSKLTCLAGYAKIPNDGESFEELYKNTVLALVKTYDGYNIRYGGHLPPCYNPLYNKFTLEEPPVSSVAINYKPIIELSSGYIIGAEPFFNVLSPEGNAVTIDCFISFCIKTGTIENMTRIILEESCRQNGACQINEDSPTLISVTLPSSEFYKVNLWKTICGALDYSNLEPQWLEIDLSKLLIHQDIDYAIRQIEMIHDLGVRITMDDFGTKFLLNYFQDFPVSSLKLNKSLTAGIENNKEVFNEVLSLTHIAKAKKIITIADGIENKSQEFALRMAGCDYGIGPLYEKTNLCWKETKKCWNKPMDENKNKKRSINK
ncbi:EAL domain-containing protein [Ruminococcus sp.]|uniref:EAL domain-containing protein n=1 Tax=Ruminococcus sp. TaxID=41978 RepID=UPI0025CFA21E|nr:EAL domain-containing protein [Ruminococcus sp.]